MFFLFTLELQKMMGKWYILILLPAIKIILFGYTIKIFEIHPPHLLPQNFPE